MKPLVLGRCLWTLTLEAAVIVRTYFSVVRLLVRSNRMKNQKIVEMETTLILVVTHIHMIDYISIDRDMVTPVLWADWHNSPLSEILQSCETLTSLPHRSLHFIGNWTPTYLSQIPHLISYMWHLNITSVLEMTDK